MAAAAEDTASTTGDGVLHAAVSEDGRITGLLLPWDQVARVGTGWERFQRGALDETLNDKSRRVPLTIGHPRASEHERIAGVLVSHHNGQAGHFGTFQLFDTPTGREAAELIRERVVSGLSVGGWADHGAVTTVIEPVTRRRVTVRSKMAIDHVGLVRRPAYEAARVLMPGERHLAVVRESPAVLRAKARQRIRARERRGW